MSILFLFFSLMAALTYRNGGPAYILNIAWLIAIAPIFFGVIEYSYLHTATDRYLWIIFLAVGSYLTAAALARLLHSPLQRRLPDPSSPTHEFQAWDHPAHFVLIIAIIAILLIMLGFVLNGVDISNLASVREQVIVIERASIIDRLAAITTWACFFCILFGLHFRSILSRTRVILFIACGIGAILASLTSAGRQSVLQLIMLLYFLQFFEYKISLGHRVGRVIIRASALVIGISLLVYVTLNRASTALEGRRTEYLLSIFGARLEFNFDSWISVFGTDFRDFITEAFLYISHTVPLFSISTEVGFRDLFHGAMSFPFLYRQLEPVIGIDVSGALLLKAQYINSANVIGVGWDTGLSSPLLDFGVPGLAVFMGVQGYFAQWSWLRAKATGEFGAILLCVLMMAAAAYTPFLPLFSDTSMFLFLCSLIPLYWFVSSRTYRARGRPFEIESS